MPRILHHTLLCPFSRKVHLMLREQDISYVSVEEHTGAPSQEYQTINPGCTGPVFVDETINLVQDQAICEYVQEVYGPNLLGTTPIARGEVRRLVQWFDTKFYTEVTLNFVYEKVTRRLLRQGVPDSGALRQGRSIIPDHLEYIGWLIDRRRWLGGDDFSLADITAAAHLSCIDYIGDVPWNKHPIAKGWYERIKSRPTFRPFLAETIRGIPPVAHYSQLDF